MASLRTDRVDGRNGVGTDVDRLGVAVVTGAASGMGRSVVDLFVKHGWDVVGVDLDTTSLDVGQPVQVDVRDRQAVADGLGTALGPDRPVRALVNAAGIYPTSTLGDFTEERYRAIFDVNVLGTLNVTAEVAPHMTGGGSIVNFSSIDAFNYSPSQLLYSASKAAVVSITRSLALELAPSISVNAIAPGWVDTPGTRAGGRLDAAVATVPAGRAAQPEEIAEWVWTLVHGSYLTGETVVVSGGVLAR